jgi:hypothetical protein
MPLVVFLLELNDPVAMRGKLGRIVQHQCRLEIGLDDVFRRRKDVGNEIVAELDPVVEWATDLELRQPVDAGGNHGTKTDGGDQSENQYRARNRQPQRHGNVLRAIWKIPANEITAI